MMQPGSQQFAGLRRRPMMRLATLALLILALVACGGGDDGPESAGSDPVDAPADGGDYSVVLVAGVDTVTADGQLADLQEAGFEGFIKEGTADTGYDVYRSGMSRDDAEELLDEIRAQLFPESVGSSLQPGLVWETGTWRSDADQSGSDGESGEAASSASITVGDMTYDFNIDLAGQCTDTGLLLFGTFATDAAGNALQGGDANRAVALSFGIPVIDFESQGLQPPQIGIDDATTGIRWQAGGLDGTGGVNPGDSEVTSWTIDDGHAEGTATFIDANALFAGREVVPTEGTFEITCAG